MFKRKQKSRYSIIHNDFFALNVLKKGSALALAITVLIAGAHTLLLTGAIKPSTTTIAKNETVDDRLEAQPSTYVFPPNLVQKYVTFNPSPRFVTPPKQAVYCSQPNTLAIKVDPNATPQLLVESKKDGAALFIDKCALNAPKNKIDKVLVPLLESMFEWSAQNNDPIYISIEPYKDAGDLTDNQLILAIDAISPKTRNLEVSIITDLRKVDMNQGGAADETFDPNEPKTTIASNGVNSNARIKN